MIFNTFPFIIFFVIVFILYWLVFNKSYRQQNIIVLISSYFFYSWADWRFLFLLIAISLFNFLLGIYINKSHQESTKKILLYIGLLQGVGGLFYFKYYNFFIDSFNHFFVKIGIQINLPILKIIVPLGISFFTFRTLSYLLDVEKGKVKVVTDWISFFTYVSYFPSILSGPIDKTKSFIPQIEKRREFDYYLAIDGLRQILWGFFKKIVIANNCATITNQIFNNYQEMPASSLLIGAVFYSVQIYCDFSGYSDMAIGVSKLLGIKISKNFDFPFFAQSIPEYWRKWHISLTVWLTEYVFTPLSISFRDYVKFGLILAIVINFVICGIWHGANWTYVLFGFFHGLYFIPSILNGTMNKKKKKSNNMFPTLREIFNIFITFTLVSLTFIFFLSTDLNQAFFIYSKIFSSSIFIKPANITLTIVPFIIFLFTIEWIGKNQEYGISKIGTYFPRPITYLFYFFLLTCIFVFSGEEQKFIYFQF